MTSPGALVNKVWNYAHVLRDDGISYGDYEQPVGSERFRGFSCDEPIARDKADLDILWLEDESLEDADSLPARSVLAAEIIESLEAALEQFRSVAEVLERIE